MAGGATDAAERESGDALATTKAPKTDRKRIERMSTRVDVCFSVEREGDPSGTRERDA